MVQSNNTISPLTYLMPSFILFAINPTLGLLYSATNAFHEKNIADSKNNLFVFFFILASWLGFINMTKVPSSDQVAYLSLYLRADKIGFYKSLFNGVNGGGTEFMYGLYTWISHYLWFGNGAMFFYVTTVIIYMLHFVSAYKVFEKLDYPQSSLICGVLVFAFFSQYFNLTNHLVRQMLAAAIAIYGICDRWYGGRRWYLWLILSCLVHTSAGILAAIGFVPSIYHKMTTKQLLINITLFVAIVAVVTSFSSVLSGMSVGVGTIDRGFSRISTGGKGDGMTVSIYTILMVVAPLIYGAYKGIKRETDPESAIYPIGYLCIAMSIFVLSLSAKPLLQYRFFYYTYSFIPFVLPLVVSQYSSNRKLIDMTIPLFLIIRFVLLHEHQVWHYAPWTDLIVTPFIYYLFDSPLNL